MINTKYGFFILEERNNNSCLTMENIFYTCIVNAAIVVHINLII